jgi:hypothetical protein
VIDDGGPQRSMVRSLTLTFAGNVAVTPGVFALTVKNAANLGGSVSAGGVTGNADGIDLAISTLTVGGNTVVRIAFTGSVVVGGSLPDGRYVLTFQGSTVSTFWRLFGDAKGEQTVTLADRSLFLAAYGSRRGMSRYNSIFDFDANGYITGLDYSVFLGNFGKSIDANGIVS